MKASSSLPFSQATENTSSKLVADLIANELREAGVELAFGVAGGEILRLIDSLGAHGIRYVGARHEAAAGFMADGSYRAGQSLGLMLATLGPGVANALGTAAHALQDGVPLIILGGRVALDVAPEFRHQVIDQVSLFRPVTKASLLVETENAGNTIRKAIALALSEPLGPVYLDCPQDVVEATVPDEALPARRSSARLGQCPGLELDGLIHALKSAERPLILAGLGALRSGVEGAVRGLLDKFPIPVITTYKAKGLVAESQDFVIGGAGLSPLADESILPYVARADLVLLLGYDPVEMRSNWNRPFAPSTRVWTLGTAAAQRAGLVATDVVEGPLDQILDQLSVGLGRNHQPSAWLDQARELRQKLTTAFSRQESWEPAALFHRLRELVGEEAFVTVDTGAHRILLSQCWQMESPGRLLQSSGFCTMACAIPLAIGAKLKCPEAQVLAVVGDGGLEMAAAELATIRDLGLAFTIIVVDDGGYGLIDMKQRARGFASAGVLWGRSDYEALARAFGGHGQSVQDIDSFDGAWKRSQEQDSFTLIHALFGREAYDGRI